MNEYKARELKPKWFLERHRHDEVQTQNNGVKPEEKELEEEEEEQEGEGEDSKPKKKSNGKDNQEDDEGSPELNEIDYYFYSKQYEKVIENINRFMANPAKGNKKQRYLFTVTLTLCYLLTKQYQLALDTATLTLDKKNYALWDLYGQACYHLNRDLEGIRSFQKASDITQLSTKGHIYMKDLLLRFDASSSKLPERFWRICARGILTKLYVQIKNSFKNKLIIKGFAKEVYAKELDEFSKEFAFLDQSLYPQGGQIEPMIMNEIKAIFQEYSTSNDLSILEKEILTWFNTMDIPARKTENEKNQETETGEAESSKAKEKMGKGLKKKEEKEDDSNQS